MSDERFWGQLIQFIEDGRVVPIVGRDLLVVQVDGRDVNLHTHLATILAKRLDVDASDLPERAELDEVACRYLAGPGRPDVEDLYPELQAVMPKAGELPVPKPLLKLAVIRPLKLFVSTTFDPMLARALDEVRFGGSERTQVVAYSPESTADIDCGLEQLDRPLVFQLLGRLSSVPEFALTEEDTLEFIHALQSKTRRPERLFDELRRQQLLIVGSQYPGWLARFFIRTTTGERLSIARGKSFIVDEAVSKDASLRSFLTHYSVRSQIFEGGAVEFVDELHRRWLERHPETTADEPAAPDAPVNSPREAGSVFLSYASDDLESVRAIRDALEEAGVDVWFDKDDLRGGDDYEAMIRRGIDRCSLFVPVISRQTLTPKRRFFRIEWNSAQEVALKAAESQKFIMPVCIDDTPPDSPAVPEKFRKLHWVRFPGGKPAADWVRQIRDLYRAYQKSLVGA